MDRKKTFISDQLGFMMIKQISHEQKNANIYAAMSNYFDSIGLNNTHKWFKDQTEEEISHAKLIIDFLTEAGFDLEFESVDAVKLELEPVSLMQLYLDTEIGTTESIKKLAEQALLDCDFISFKFLNDFIHNQLAEENEAQTRLQIFLTTKDLIIADDALGDL